MEILPLQAREFTRAAGYQLLATHTRKEVSKAEPIHMITLRYTEANYLKVAETTHESCLNLEKRCVLWSKSA